MSQKKAASFLKKLWRVFKKLTLWLFILQFVYIILLRWVNPPITMTQLVSWVSGHGLKRDYVSYKNMSSNAKLAVMASEDQLFATHRGFDWKSIQQAMEYNEKQEKKMRGGSTISQQVAKNVFLWQGRSYVRKGLEMYFTFMIETFWSKKRILEMYLNVIEMGDGIFGIEAASQSYFNKPASAINREEAARIAACLPSPKRYKVKPPSPYVQRRTSFIMRQMNNIQNDEKIAALLTGDTPKKVEPAKEKKKSSKK